MEDLVGYLMNLADDMQGRLAHGAVGPAVLTEVVQQLRKITDVLETGAPIFQVPANSQSPRPTREALPRPSQSGVSSPTTRSRFDS